MNPVEKIAEIYKQMRLGEAKKKMDPVGDADSDIDNDGDVDDSDEYLHNRRKAIKKSMKEQKVECPKCEGKGCNHCDDKGYHMEAISIDPDDGEVTKAKDDSKKKKKTDASSGNDTSVSEDNKSIKEAAPKISMGKAKGSISATGMRGKGMKKYDVDVSVTNGKLEFKIKDEQGKFQTVGIKQAASMLGEDVEVTEVAEPTSPLGKKFKDMHKVEIDDTEEKGHMDAVRANKAGPRAKQPKSVKELRK